MSAFAGVDPGQLDFSGRRVLVTGAAGGIGSAMAHAFAAHGATLALADRDAAGLARIAAALPTAATRHVYDQADPASVLALAREVGAVDVLLNNAGIVAYGPVESHDAALVESVVRTNLLGPILLATEVGRGMLERGRGVVVNTSSQLAFCGAAHRAVYAATKAGVSQFTRSIAAEWAPRGVRVVALGPGRTLTPLNAAVLATDEARAEALRAIPAGRFGSPQEMARLALVLASDLGDYVVGETLIADGGYVVAG